jgi:sulfopyruvate decarboxylase subunit alpha
MSTQMTPGEDMPRYAQLFLEGLKEAGVAVVAAVPESLLAGVYRGCARDNSIRYIPVTNESELPGICAGTYLAGKKAIMVMENSGLRQACGPIARFSFCHAMPLVMAMSFRGEWGERNWWGHNHAQTMEPILNALRIPFRFISRLDEIKPSIKKSFYHADSSNWPVAMVFTGERHFRQIVLRPVSVAEFYGEVMHALAALEAAPPPHVDRIDVAGPGFINFFLATDAYHREFIQKKLVEADGNVSRAAELMGVDRSHLYRRMKALEDSPDVPLFFGRPAKTAKDIATCDHSHYASRRSARAAPGPPAAW